ncbi:hypothetical protein ID866_10069, partial [Astraeus odoratus]
KLLRHHLANKLHLHLTPLLLPPPPPPPPAPPPKPKPKPESEYVTALYDFDAQADGDLSFKIGDRIEVVVKPESRGKWWTGRLNGIQGAFPGNYVQ